MSPTETAWRGRGTYVWAVIGAFCSIPRAGYRDNIHGCWHARRARINLLLPAKSPVLVLLPVRTPAFPERLARLAVAPSRL